MAALLIVRGADVNVRDKAGSAPLDEAARRGFREIAQELIQHGATVDQADPDHRLHAAQRGRAQGPPRSGGAAAREGRGSETPRKAGASPIENAARGRHAEVAGASDSAGGRPRRRFGALLTESAIKGQTEIADLLIAKGANVDARDKSGATPLHQAALKGNLAFATLLLQHGADVNARDGDGATPLHNAALSGRREVAALLLDKGADREARDSESGATPLYHAAAWGRTALVELLIARGADVNAENKAGVTPLTAAEKNGFSETAAVLKQHGAK